MAEVLHPTSSAQNQDSTPLISYVNGTIMLPSYEGKGGSPQISGQPSAGDAFVTWSIYWRTPASIVFLFLVGLASGIGHHIFYSAMDGTEAGDASHQQWTIRVGSYFAYLLALSLAAMVSVARDQWLWHTLRTQFITLEGINAMFSVTSNPLDFFNRDMVQRAWVSAAMAVVKWVLPLSVVLTPGTISVFPWPVTTSVDCTVPSIKFDYDTDTDSVKLDSDYFTEKNILSNDEPYYIYPSARARQIFTVPAYSGRVTAGSDRAPLGSTLGKDCLANCTYSVQFQGPAVSCTEITPYNLTSAPWDTVYDFSCDPAEDYDREGILLYRAQRSNVSYNTLWVLYTTTNSSRPDEACRIPHAYTCQSSVARYYVNLSMSDNHLSEPVITTVDILYTINNSPLTPNLTTTATNSTSYSEPYRPNWVFFDVLLEILEGTWTIDTEAYQTPNRKIALATMHVNGTKIGSTELVLSGIGGEPATLLGQAIETMVSKMVVSLLSDRSLYMYAANATATCSSTIIKNIYLYNQSSLIAVYVPVLGVSSLMAVSGIIALRLNGVASNASFSTIMLTTRNQALDRLTEGACMGGEPLPKRLKEMKLKFGDVSGRTEDHGVGHAAIGVEGDGMTEIQKGWKYS